MQALDSERDFNRLCMNNFGKVLVIVFYSQWHEHSLEYTEQMDDLIELAEFKQSQIMFNKVEAELVPEVATRFNVNNVPTVIFTDTQKVELKKFENEAPGMIIEHIEAFLKEYQKTFEEKKVVMYKKIEELIKSAPVLIFIKGSAADPYCKFSKQFLTVMQSLDCQFTYYDILADTDMRHWLRHYNKWPTYPQLYIEGELIGGLDKTKQLMETGEVQKKIPESAKTYNPEQRFNKIINDNSVILFTQGQPNSTDLNENHVQTIQILKDTGIKFNCFDVLQDKNLNKFLSEKYGEQNFPILVSNKNYVGTLEQLKELQKQEKLLDKIPSSEWQLNGQQKLKYLLQQCPVIAFINGIPKETHNEGSQKLVDILKNLNVVYEFYNVDADEELQQNLFALSKYEKTPQLYVKGQLIGGIDSVEQLQKDGDLQELVKNYLKK